MNTHDTLPPVEETPKETFRDAAPRIDIFENDENYRVRADLPGVLPGDLELEYERGELRLEARRSAPSPGEPLRRSFGSVQFRRVLRLPDDIQADAISADFRQGVLELVLPKAPEHRPRKIPVQVH